MTNQASALKSFVVGVLCVGFVACENDVTEDWRGPSPAATPSAAPQARSPDRLPPGKMMEGSEEVFGFKAPKGMQVVRARRNAQITGRADFDELTQYVKDRISVRHAEMGGDKLVFAHAKIRGGSDILYTLTIRPQGSGVMLNIQSEEKTPPTHGLSEKQRWERAGMKPTGGLIDPHGME